MISQVGCATLILHMRPSWGLALSFFVLVLHWLPAFLPPTCCPCLCSGVLSAAVIVPPVCSPLLPPFFCLLLDAAVSPLPFHGLPRSLPALTFPLACRRLSCCTNGTLWRNQQNVQSGVHSFIFQNRKIPNYSHDPVIICHNCAVYRPFLLKVWLKWNFGTFSSPEPTLRFTYRFDRPSSLGSMHYLLYGRS